MKSETEITKREQAEQALRESEKRYKRLLETVTDYIYSVKVKNGRPIISVRSPGCVTVTGYTAEAYETNPSLWQHIVYEEDRVTVTEQINKAFAGEEASAIEHRLVHKDGSIRWVRNTLVPRYDASGRFYAYDGLIVDITTRKQTEAEVRALNSKLFSLQFAGAAIAASLDLQYVLDTLTSEMVILLDAEGCVISEWDKTTGSVSAIAECTPSNGKSKSSLRPTCHLAEFPIFERVLTERYAHQVTRNQPDLESAELAYMQTFNIETLLVLPMEFQNDVPGLVEVLGSRNGRIFTNDEIALAQLLANQAASAIQNARLYERAQQEIKERKRLLEAVKQQRQQLRALSRQLAEIQEVERQQLAHELHDQVGQNLSAISLDLNIIQNVFQTHGFNNTPEADLILNRIDDALLLVDQTADPVRNVMSNLRPPVLDDYGLLAALTWYGSRFASRAGLTIKVKGEEPDPRLAAPIENTLFRIAQEALTNVGKHAQATRTEVTLVAANSNVRLAIADNGIGFELGPIADFVARQSWGLLAMSERAEAMGGQCHIQSEPGQGTQIIVEVSR